MPISHASSSAASDVYKRQMYDPMVQLKSGGYLIINPTEALVSIDINSCLLYTSPSPRD